MRHVTNVSPRSDARNKTAVLPYLDSSGPPPLRFAKSTLIYSSHGNQTVQQIIIGPIERKNQTISWEPLSFPFTRGSTITATAADDDYSTNAIRFGHIYEKQGKFLKGARLLLV